MIFAALLLLTGLTISVVAIYYSVIGLTAIFAAAFWPIVVMGVTLEAAKLVAASWLKYEWNRIPFMLKSYLTVAVIILMIITSMGIFGFLSKAHLDQNIVSGDVIDKVALLDEKIKTQRDNIAASRKALEQMDAQVDARLTRSDDEKGAERAVQIRRNQQAERTRLQKEIAQAQSEISKLNSERAPIATELRKVEAEVGPIKYIAKLIYGDNPDANLLEKAVTWVIILIVIVFDPLAVLLLISAQMAWMWARESREKESQEYPEPQDTGYVHGDWPFPLEEEKIDIDKINEEIAEIDKEIDVDQILDTAEKNPVTVDTTVIKVDEKQLYETGDIENISKESVEKFDEEVLEDSSKKKDLYDQGSRESDSEDQGPITYIQNAEQDENTLWNRLAKKDQLKAIDRLYKEYSEHEFKILEIDKIEDPELYEFIEKTKTVGPKFNNYNKDTLERFAEKIYELRKNQSNNTPG